MEIQLNNPADPTTLLLTGENCTDCYDLGAIVALLQLASIQHVLRPITNDSIQLVIPLQKEPVAKDAF